MSKKPKKLEPVPAALEHTRDFYTIKETAAKVGVSEQRIRALLKAKRIVGAKKHGHAWMVPIPFVVLKAQLRPRAMTKLSPPLK